MHDTMLKKRVAFFLTICCLVAVAFPSSAEEEGECRPKASKKAVREAATRAVRLVEQTSAKFLETRKCFTCHTQTLSAMVLKEAGGSGFDVDEQNFKRQFERAFGLHSSLLKTPLNGLRVDTVGYGLWALDIGQHAPDDMTKDMVSYLLNYQKKLGFWKVTVDRPPAEASNFTTNYVAIRGLNRYGTAEQQEEIAARTTAVKQWLATAETTDTEDEVFRLRLAHELKIAPEKKGLFVQKLLGEQHDSGGWAQKPGMKPDAYATGSTLVALHESGGLPWNHPSWQRGLDYLLRTQKPDGSWHVVTRAGPMQVYFESGFPHGKDQFISAYATGWATMALLLSLRQEN